MERNLAIFKDGIHGHAKLLSAIATEKQTWARTLPLFLALRFDFAIPATCPTMGANWAIRPANRLKVFAGCIFIVESGFVKNRVFHGCFPLSDWVKHTINHGYAFVKVIIAFSKGG